jgi:hypothetical protein
MNIARSLGFVAARSALPFFILFQGAVVEAQPQSKPGAAPPLRDCKVTATSDLGLWDDAFVPHNEDFVVMRRGDQFFSLAMAAYSVPKKIAKAPGAEHTQIVAGAVLDKRCWLFLNSTKVTPCVVDANSGTVVTFEIPDLKVPGSQVPGIQSCVLVPQAKAALVMVSGGDRSTWPRDGNRPVFFWMDLKSGKLVRFPNGWDLDYFSADERVAVFATPVEERFEKRPYQAIEMTTGERVEQVPDRRKESYVPFDWSDTQTVKPLYERREGKGDAAYFAGLSVAGLPLPIALGLDDVRYLSMARVSAGFAGFRLRHEGASRGEPSPLWIVPIKEPGKAESIATEVTDFTILGQWNVVFVTVGQGRKGASSKARDHAEAFFHAHADKTSWNVLEGVERLPKLDKAFAEADFVVDRMMVRLIEGFGSNRNDPLMVCLCEHHRADSRALSLQSDEKLLPSVTWRRAVVITHEGRRSLTPFFREGNLPDQIWLHKSGKLITGTYVWNESESGRKRRVQLSESTLQKP